MASMDDLITAIENAQDLEKNVEYYFTMTSGERAALLKQLGRTRREDTGVFLNAIYPDEPDKELRKLVRKMIFQLKSSGVRVEEPRPEGQPVLHKVEETRAHIAFLTNYDWAGSRLIIAAYEVKRNTFVFLNGELHFREGLRELMSSPLRRKDLDQLIVAYRENTREPAFLAAISPAYAAYIIEEGSKRSGRFADAVHSIKSFVSHLTDSVHRPADIYELPVPAGTEAMNADDVLGHPVFLPFSITWDEMEEDRKTYLSGSGSTIVLPQHLADERSEAFLDGLIRKESIASQRPLFRRMLEDYAYFFHATGDTARYLGTVSILHDDHALDRAVTFFVKKNLKPAEEGSATQEGLIVDPYGQVRS